MSGGGGGARVIPRRPDVFDRLGAPGVSGVRFCGPAVGPGAWCCGPDVGPQHRVLRVFGAVGRLWARNPHKRSCVGAQTPSPRQPSIPRAPGPTCSLTALPCLAGAAPARQGKAAGLASLRAGPAVQDPAGIPAPKSPPPLPNSDHPRRPLRQRVRKVPDRSGCIYKPV
jgi:hypothetical protein